ncbi:hypothetical protein [Methylobacterium aquaticum]|uniref:hypothetical protein n=1 Tax=Methylobacterium aquaticum TaxID=270351 RepID=UPI001931E36A|nr:hypothetical protein [Methylobacterium aquaticum]QRE75504.1 hypothetical protein F1D61_19655 [Methylobacterium aquaticum]
MLDTALAEQLGMAKPEDVRRTIEANREELEAFGIIAVRAINTGNRGRPGRAFYLNREQALLICILSKTSKAKEVRAEVIRVFTAWTRG